MFAVDLFIFPSCGRGSRRSYSPAHTDVSTAAHSAFCRHLTFTHGCRHTTHSAPWSTLLIKCMFSIRALTDMSHQCCMADIYSPGTICLYIQMSFSSYLLRKKTCLSHDAKNILIKAATTRIGM